MRIIRHLTRYKHDYFDDHEEIKLNAVANNYRIARLAWAVYLAVVFSSVYLFLLERDAARYAYLFGYFILPALAFLISPVIVFFSRFKMKDPLKPVLAEMVFSVACLGLMSVFTGKGTHLYLVSLSLIPVPFFVLHSNRRRLLVFTETVMISVILLQFALVFLGKYKVDMPADIFAYIQPMVAVCIGTIFVQIGHIVRSTEREHRHRLREARQQVEDAYTRIKVRDQRIQSELKFAADIQQSIMQYDHDPSAPFTVQLNSMAYGKVTGDYCDMVKTDDGWFIMVADASGHGVPAALITIVARQALRDALALHKNTGDAMALINRRLTEAVQTSDFMTAFLLHINNDGRLNYTSAAHCPASLVRHSTNRGIEPTVEELDTRGMLLGVISDPPNPWERKETTLLPGDRIVLYTDGVAEERNRQGEELGHERFKSWLRELYTDKHEDYHQALWQAWLDFTGHDDYSDDVTLMTIEYRAAATS